MSQISKQNKPRILVLTSTFPRWSKDSTPPFVQYFAETLAKYMESVYVLAPHYKNAKVSERIGHINVQRYRYFLPESQQTIVYDGGGVSKITASPLYLLKLFCLVSALFIHTSITVLVKKIDIINPHWAIPQGFVAIMVKFITRRKVILTVHGSDIFGMQGRFMNVVKRFVLRHSDTVCVNSNATRVACEDIYKRNDYQVIPMGIDTDYFRPHTPSDKLMKKYNLDKFTILFVGRLTEVKGIVYLCEAAKHLHDSGYSFKLIIVGEGPLRNHITRYIKLNNLQGKIILTGWIDVSELPQYYSIASVVVGPSLSEAQGIAFLEALSSGVPVLASDVGGVPDIIIDGLNGFLLRPKSSQDIYEKIEMLINHPKTLKRMSQYAAKSVSEAYSWDIVAQKYSRVVKDRLE